MWGDYWPRLTSNLTSPGTGSIPPDPNFDAKVKDICQVYLNAQASCQEAERRICLDEMTEIQALERKAPDLLLRPGRIQRREY